MAVDLNYEKDSKERIPYEHYLEVYQNADPKEISSRCDVPYDAEKQEFTVSLMKAVFPTGFRGRSTTYFILEMMEAFRR